MRRWVGTFVYSPAPSAQCVGAPARCVEASVRRRLLLQESTRRRASIGEADGSLLWIVEMCRLSGACFNLQGRRSRTKGLTSNHIDDIHRHAPQQRGLPCAQPRVRRHRKGISAPPLLPQTNFRRHRRTRLGH